MRTGALCACGQSPSPAVVLCGGAGTTLDRNFAFDYARDSGREWEFLFYLAAMNGAVLRLSHDLIVVCPWWYVWTHPRPVRCCQWQVTLP
jgi:hypothetical protein